MNKTLFVKALSFFLVCLAIGIGLNLARPMVIGEEWMYREKSLNLLDRTTDLLSQYSTSANDYSRGVIDPNEFKKRISSYDSSIEIIDSEAHRLTLPKGYEDFHDHFIKGIHGAYDTFFYMSLWASNYGEYNLTKSLEDLNAAMNETNYAKSIMPEPKTPKIIDPAWIGSAIVYIGAIVAIVYVAYRHIRPFTLSNDNSKR